MHEARPLENDVRPAVVTIDADADLARAGTLMKTHCIGCLVVVDHEKRLAGIVSERDLVVRVLGEDLRPTSVRVRDVMTRDVTVGKPGITIPEAEHLMAVHGIRHLPIVQDGVPIGMISTREVLKYKCDQDAILRQAAEQVARMFSSLRSLDFDEVVRLVLREVPQTLGASRSVLCFGREDGQEPAAEIHRADCPCPEAQLVRTLHGQTDDGRCPFVESAEDIDAGRRVVLPLNLSARTEGQERPGAGDYLCMCGVDADEGRRGLVDYKVSLMREALGANLANAKLYEKYQAARREALTDPLTGLAARRLVESRLAEECARSRRNGQELTLALIDVDQFKAINDERGHLVGDEVLALIASALAAEARETDLAGRLGGDEFVLILPGTSAEQVEAALGRVRQRLAAAETPGDAPLSFSAGLASSSSLDGHEMLRRADVALHEAKRGGRGQCMSWQRATEENGDCIQPNRAGVSAVAERIDGMVGRVRDGFMEGIQALVRALDARDPHATDHSENVARYAAGIARQLHADRQDADVICRAALLHDLGKIAVPDEVLRKTGPLEPAERALMEEHPLVASRILGGMSLLDRELIIVRQHHERWDGRGYPDAAAGQRICPGARVLAVADALDAMTAGRYYRRALPLSEALEIIMTESGRQFAPEVAEALMQWVAELRKRRGPDSRELTRDDLLADSTPDLLAA